jgi:Ser/Thr protein kinase RdoA (MazF antagonist)
MANVAETLGRLHDTPINGLERSAPTDQVGELIAAALLVCRLLPDLAAQTRQLAELLSPALVEILEGESTTHGSFHDDQVLVGEQGVVIIDLDSAVAGNPLSDVAHFLSYLSAEGETEAHARFLDSYEAARPCSMDDLPLLEAASLLRWATLPFRELRPDWPQAVEHRVRLAAARVDGGLAGH